MAEPAVKQAARAELDDVTVQGPAPAAQTSFGAQVRLGNRGHGRSGRAGRRSGMCTFCCMSLPPVGELVGVKRTLSELLPLATDTQCRLCAGPLSFEESWDYHVLSWEAAAGTWSAVSPQKAVEPI